MRPWRLSKRILIYIEEWVTTRTLPSSNITSLSLLRFKKKYIYQCNIAYIHLYAICYLRILRSKERRKTRLKYKWKRKKKKKKKNIYTEQQLNITRVILSFFFIIRFASLLTTHYIIQHIFLVKAIVHQVQLLFMITYHETSGEKKENVDVFRETRESVTSLLHVIIDKYVSLSFFFFLSFSYLAMCVCMCVLDSLTHCFSLSLSLD